MVDLQLHFNAICSFSTFFPAAAGKKLKRNDKSREGSNVVDDREARKHTTPRGLPKEMQKKFNQTRWSPTQWGVAAGDGWEAGADRIYIADEPVSYR
jgi:hypothetical protein